MVYIFARRRISIFFKDNKHIFGSQGQKTETKHVFVCEGGRYIYSEINLEQLLLSVKVKPIQDPEILSASLFTGMKMSSSPDC